MTERDPLTVHRGLILSRALIAGAAGLVPVPYLDDLLAGAVRAALLRRLGQLRNVDLDANAVDALGTPRGSRVLGAASFGAAALAGSRRVFRKIAASLLVVRRADEAVQTFQLGTLFDHYCARHHVGFGLDGKRALAVRRAMDRAIKSARGDAAERAFRRALASSSALALGVPRGLYRLWAERRGKPLSPDRVEPIEERLERAASTSLIARAVAAADGQLKRGYVDALTAAFDAAWAEESREPAP